MERYVQEKIEEEIEKLETEAKELQNFIDTKGWMYKSTRTEKKVMEKDLEFAKFLKQMLEAK